VNEEHLPGVQTEFLERLGAILSGEHAAGNVSHNLILFEAEPVIFHKLDNDLAGKKPVDVIQQELCL
jgi:hypothetical protein